jgi:hypothetical protein
MKKEPNFGLEENTQIKIGVVREKKNQILL